MTGEVTVGGAAPEPPKEPATPRKRSHGEAFGFEIEEAIQLQSEAQGLESMEDDRHI